MAEADPPPRVTPLRDLHIALGGRMVAFAGWSLPVHYPAGILAEHAQCRERAALFDVSHMGQIALRHAQGVERAAEALERLTPAGVTTLPEGKARYALFTNDRGGVLDDLIVGHAGDHLFLVVNASRAEADAALLEAGLAGTGVSVERLDRALLAVQGPSAWRAVETIAPEALALRFMETATAAWKGADLRISRLGYTGEDGFEISCPPEAAVALAEALIAHPSVAPAGLGARDSLRLEACLPLYGADLDETVTPVEAGLGWSIPKRRLAAGDFPGAAVIARETAEGPRRRLVAIRPDDKAPARAGAEITVDGAVVGRVTSGGFGPTVGGPVSLGLVEAAHARPGSAVGLVVRGATRPARIVDSPFTPHRYKR
jgi:aminomethyltransferase